MTLYFIALEDQPSPPRKPGYIQIDQVVNSLTYGLLQNTIHGSAVHLKLTRPTYYQIDPVPNLLASGGLQNTVKGAIVHLTLKRPPYTQTDQASNSLILGIKFTPPFVPYSFPDLITKKTFRHSDVIRPDVLPQGPSSGKPFFSTDTPNPVIRRDVPLADMMVVSYDYPYPHNQYEWPVPKRPISPQTDQVLNQKLLGIVPGLPPVFSVDQTNPSRRPIALTPDQFPNLLASKLTPPLVLPFNFYDWKNPNPRNNDLYAHTFNSSSVSYFKPFNQQDWPATPKSFYKQQDATGPNTIVLGIPPLVNINTTVLRIPLFTPVVRPIARPPDSFSTPIVLSAKQPAAPFHQNDQPSPPRRPISYQDQNTPPSAVLGIKPLSAPLYLNDQPNPPRRPISNQDFNIPVPLALGIPVPALPLFSTDIPNPAVVRIRLQPDVLPNRTIYITNAPILNVFNNYDWTLLVRRKDINNEGIWILNGIRSNMPGGQSWNVIQDNDTPNWTGVNPTSGAWTPTNTAQQPNWGAVVSPKPPFEGGVT